MTRSANEVMQDVLFAAVIDSILALKTASQGLPNNLLRDLNAIHANTTFGDLPKDVQSAIQASVRSAFTRLLREGYSVSAAGAPPPRSPPAPTGPAGRFPPRGGRPPARRPEGARKPGQGPRDGKGGGKGPGGGPGRGPRPR